MWQYDQIRRFAPPIAFTLAGFGLVIIILVGVSNSLAVRGTSSCPSGVRPVLKAFVTEPGPVKLGPLDKTAFISFKENRRAEARRAVLTAAPALHDPNDEPLPPGTKGFRIRAEFEEELSAADGTTITQLPGFTITKQITDSGKLRICLRFDPRTAGTVAPNAYDGTLVITSKPQGMLEEYPLHVTVVLRKSRRSGLIAAICGFAFGVVAKMLSELAAAKNPTKKLDALIAYLSQWSYLLAFFAGALTVVLAYVQLYADNAHWGASDLDWLKLFGACLAGQLSGIGVADLAKRAVEGQPTAA